MNHQQREELRQEVLDWIQSKSFDSYFSELHFTLSTLGIGFLGCLLKPGRINPLGVIRGARHGRVATGSLRRRYLQLGESGQVVMANTWMANSGLTCGEVQCAPGLLIAGADGTTEADDYVHHITQRLVDMTDHPPTSAEEHEIQAMLDDEEYHTFRVRTLPLAFTEDYPVYLFDTMLHSSVVAGGELKEMPFIVCVVHPDMQPAILPIPISIVSRHIR